MTFFKAGTTIVLLFVICDVTSAFGSRGRRPNSFLGRFNQRATAPQQGTCDWIADPTKLNELKWAGRVDLCMETGQNFIYPTSQVDIALQNDPFAQMFFNTTKSCYNYKDQSYYQPWATTGTMYSQDLCAVRPYVVDKVWRYNNLDRKRDHCYIVRPEEQRVVMAQCGDLSGHPDSQKCKRDSLSYFQGNYYCVPDGYITRLVLIYCPWDPEVQCRPAEVRVPTGCSCKQYTCDKGLKKQLSSASSSVLARLGSIGK